MLVALVGCTRLYSEHLPISYILIITFGGNKESTVVIIGLPIISSESLLGLS